MIFPGSAFMTVCKAVADLMQGLKEFGTTAHLMDSMVGLTECFEMMGLSQMLAQDAKYAQQEILSGGLGRFTWTRAQE